MGKGPGALILAVTAAMLLATGAVAQPAPKYPISKAPVSKSPASKAPVSKAAAPRAPVRQAPVSKARVVAPPPPPPEPPPPPPEPPSRFTTIRQRTTEIVTQPVRDVGISKVEIPPVLVVASTDPYSVKGLANCRQIADAVTELNDAIGPDFASAHTTPESRTGKVAEAGGRMLVNSIMPFRGLVREVSGAAPAERRLAAAVDAGFARRGYLRGLQSARKCKV